MGDSKKNKATSGISYRGYVGSACLEIRVGVVKLFW